MRVLSPIYILLLEFSLIAGCSPAQQAAFCAIASDGTVLALAVTQGGAQATAQKIAAVQSIVPCSTAVAIGTQLAAAALPTKKAP